MRTVILSICLLASASLANSQEEGALQPSDQRRSAVTAFLNEHVELDGRTRSMADALVNVYIQSLEQISAGMPMGERARGVYRQVKENHLGLLADYVTEAQLAAYEKALLEDTDPGMVCRFCEYPKKNGRNYCAFCGAIFEPE